MKIAMVTGPSSGIGLATAVELARRGYHIVAAGRSEQRTRPVVDGIVANGGSAEYLHLDLASLDSCSRAGQSFVRTGQALDVLINNAGVGGVSGVTEDGFEIHFGVNHLGHFMLTHHLRPSFRSGTRIVVVSSEAHRSAKGIDFSNARKRRGLLTSLAAYSESKLANILFARRLARFETGWRVYSLHPGLADTNIIPAFVKPFLRNLETPEQAATTSVWCATSDEVANETGLYYSRMRHREPSPVAQDDRLADELWERSTRWCNPGPAA